MVSARLKYDKPTYYSNEVLLGNWVEEKIGRYKKNQYKHITVYDQDFTPKYAIDKKDDDDIRNDIKIRSEHGDSISTPHNEESNYFNNFSTVYDLSYQYFPKWIHGSINRRIRFRLFQYEPTNEYLNGYGNLSSRNALSEGKREEWESDVLDCNGSISSVSKADYIQYDAEAYKLSKWPRLRPIKVKSGHAMDTVYKQLPSNHPRSLASRRNPITWEGPDDNASGQNCVCKM